MELAVKRVLEPIYETVFEDSSSGYRPERNQHTCLDALGRTMQQKRISHVVEADIRGFFDAVHHGWMVTFLQHRIGAPRIIRLLWRMLKGGILEDGLVTATEAGTPQGSILTPPTKLQTFFFRSGFPVALIDPKHDMDLVMSHFDMLDQGTDNLALAVPVYVL